MNQYLPGNISGLRLLGLGAVIVLCALAPSLADAEYSAFAKSADYCHGTLPNGDPKPCGKISIYNYGGYVIDWTRVEATENPYDSNSACGGISITAGGNLQYGAYGEFIVPAPCRYQFTMKIAGGDKKGKHLYLTPGCAFKLKSDGETHSNNKPRTRSIKWIKQFKQYYEAKGTTLYNNDVSDFYWHQAQGKSEKHPCLGD